MSSSIDRLDEHRSPASRHPAGVVHRDLAMVLLKCDTLSEKTELEAVRTRIHLWEAYSLYGQLAEAAPLVDEAIMERHINVQITGACAKGRVARAREDHAEAEATMVDIHAARAGRRPISLIQHQIDALRERL